MDPFSLTVGIASIASVFQTCLHGYRTLNTAMAIGGNALTLNVQFRVEELRLYLWGRNWGLVKDPTQVKTTRNPGSDPDGESDVNATAFDKQKVVLHSSLELVDEDLEIPGLRDLTIEVLGRIQKALDEWKLIGQQYGAAPGNRKIKSLSENTTGPKVSSKEAVSRVPSKQTEQEKEISDRTRFATKLRWAIKDKTALEALLLQLTNLNDSLEKLLPRRQRASLARGLAGEILNVLEGTAANNYGANIDEQLSRLSGLGEAKAAQIVSLKRSNFTEKAERMPTEKRGDDSDDVTNSRTPFSKSAVWVEGEKGSMQIPFENFVRLPEPKIQYYEVQKGTRGKSITSKYVPLQRSLAIYAPAASTSDSSMDTPAQAALVEWRPTAHESRATELSEEDLKDRRDHIARLLHRTSATDADFRVLDCMGYTMTSAHTPDGATHGLVGYVYRYPDFATPKSLPVTLRDLLGEAYDSNDPNVPSLEDRFKLARNLAIAMYQLQCAGWVHRKISSYNIIFFKDRETEKLDLGHPFLVGWQYSRPDDQRRLYPSEGSAEGIGDLDMYVHRARLFNHKGRFPRFRKSFDIYSLGIVLMEIAFWEPILALTTEEQKSKMSKFETIGSGGSAKSWWEAISNTAEKELAPEMGGVYRDAVLFCLHASGDGPEETQAFWEEDTDRNPRDPYFWDTGFEEVGIEKDFYWRVLKPLEKFGL